MLAIIIVNYKSEQRTIDYVKKELSKITTSYKVVIVNNGAVPESDNLLLQSLSAHLVTNVLEPLKSIDNNCFVISNPENTGFARGNNMGAVFAKLNFYPTYLLFSNNDIRFLSRDVVEKLIAKLAHTPEAGIIGPKIIGLDGELQSPEPFFSFWDNYIWVYLSTLFYTKEAKRKRFRMDYAQNATEGFHYKVMGSFFLVRASDFFQSGMMDPNTFLFHEEEILSERMKRIGRYVYYYPTVTVIHEHGTTIKKYNSRKKMREINFKSACYYYRTYIGVSYFEILIGTIVKNILNILHK